MNNIASYVCKNVHVQMLSKFSTKRNTNRTTVLTPMKSCMAKDNLQFHQMKGRRKSCTSRCCFANKFRSFLPYI